MRKLLSLLLVLALCCSLVGCGGAEQAETTAAATVETAPAKEDVVILYTNDVHTYIDGVLSYDVIAGLKAELEKTYGNVLLVDAGDHIQGTAFGSMDKGKTIIDLMNAAGYDLATLGNHEFDYGMDGTMNVLQWAQFPYVSCNFYHEDAAGLRGENVLDAYKIFDIGGRMIGFVASPPPNPSPSPLPLTSRMKTATTSMAFPAARTVLPCMPMSRRALMAPRLPVRRSSLRWAIWATTPLPSPGLLKRPLPMSLVWMPSSTATPTPPLWARALTTRTATQSC